MKLAILLVVFSTAVFAQPFGFGIKGGVPMTVFVNAVSQSNPSLSYVVNTNRYVVGPMAQLRLPFGLGIEVDALYRHYGFNGAPGSVTTGAWEFPLGGKYKFKTPIGRPSIERGVATAKRGGVTP